MAAVKWDSISGYINTAFNAKKRIERADVIDLAEFARASDDVIDALDAIGSRVFTSISELRDYLVAQGYVVKQ